MRWPSSVVALVAGLAAGGALPACRHHIGDSCKTNIDCSPLGDRFCDVSEPGGYCTIEGCDVILDDQGNQTDSCPTEAVCVRFFSPIASEPCDPVSEAGDCAPDERCLCDCSDPRHPGQCLHATLYGNGTDGGASSTCNAGVDGGVAPRLGHCAPASSERRWCQYLCSTTSDCRGGYECRQTGTHGAESVPRRIVSVPVGDGGTLMVPVGDPQQFCVPTGQ